MSLKWVDATTYSRDDRDRTPHAWKAYAGQFRVTVTNGHIHYKGQWVMHFHPLLNTHLIEAADADEARAVAERVVRKLLTEALADLPAGG